MPAKKPSAKPSKAKKTVSAKSTARKSAAKKAKTAPKKSAPRKKATKTPSAAKAKSRASTKKAPGQASPAMGVSLLSGPRNVQPYVSTHGEDYMNAEQLSHFRTILSSWKRDLMQEVDRTVLHMKDEAANFPDPNDRATQESEFSLELRTRDRERKLIRKIDEALARIDDGSYGYCLETGEPIGVKRLEARPVATLSVEAQERRERREKQFGDRDDYR
jgi:DnaK suppressor protein